MAHSDSVDEGGSAGYSEVGLRILTLEETLADKAGLRTGGAQSSRC